MSDAIKRKNAALLAESIRQQRAQLGILRAGEQVGERIGDKSNTNDSGIGVAAKQIGELPERGLTIRASDFGGLGTKAGLLGRDAGPLAADREGAPILGARDEVHGHAASVPPHRERRKRIKVWRTSVRTAPAAHPAADFMARVDAALDIGRPGWVAAETTRRMCQVWYWRAQRGGTCILQATAVALGRMGGKLCTRGRECVRLVRDWLEENGLIDVLGGRVRRFVNGIERVVNDACVLVFPQAPPPPLPADVAATEPPRHGLSALRQWLQAVGLVPRATGWLNTSPLRPARAPP
jgi:hypothetical protein